MQRILLTAARWRSLGSDQNRGRLDRTTEYTPGEGKRPGEGKGAGSLAWETSDDDGSNRAAQPSIVGTDFNLVNPSLNLGDVIFPTFSVL